MPLEHGLLSKMLRHFLFQWHITGQKNFCSYSLIANFTVKLSNLTYNGAVTLKNIKEFLERATFLYKFLFTASM